MVFFWLNNFLINILNNFFFINIFVDFVVMLMIVNVVFINVVGSCYYINKYDSLWRVNGNYKYELGCISIVVYVMLVCRNILDCVVWFDLVFYL